MFVKRDQLCGTGQIFKIIMHCVYEIMKKTDYNYKNTWWWRVMHTWLILSHCPLHTVTVHLNAKDHKKEEEEEEEEEQCSVYSPVHSAADKHNISLTGVVIIRWLIMIHSICNILWLWVSVMEKAFFSTFSVHTHTPSDEDEVNYGSQNPQQQEDSNHHSRNHTWWQQHLFWEKTHDCYKPCLCVCVCIIK